jgi:hypothetical protein
MNHPEVVDRSPSSTRPIRGGSKRDCTTPTNSGVPHCGSVRSHSWVTTPPNEVSRLVKRESLVEVQVDAVADA